MTLSKFENEVALFGYTVKKQMFSEGGTVIDIVLSEEEYITVQITKNDGIGISIQNPNEPDFSGFEKVVYTYECALTVIKQLISKYNK